MPRLLVLGAQHTILSTGEHMQAFAGACPGSSLTSVAWDSGVFEAPEFSACVSRLRWPARQTPRCPWHQLSRRSLLAGMHTLFFPVGVPGLDKDPSTADKLSQPSQSPNDSGSRRQVGDKRGAPRGSWVGSVCLRSRRVS